MSSGTPIRTRFAPSPTGPLHLGGVRTALYSYLFAKNRGGEFLLRIEDTDRNRYVPGAEAYILEALAWCGIVHDGPVTRQSEHGETYKTFAEQLIAAGHAYHAFDTNEELEQARQRATDSGGSFSYDVNTRGNMNNSLVLPASETARRLASGMPSVIRLKVPAGETIVFDDLVRGEVSVASDGIDDKVLVKSDGMPTYHLAHIVDDHLSGITHAIRGEEWLPSAPAHVLIYRYLGWERPAHAHLPLILKPSGKGKLSKRDGDALGFPVFPVQWKDPDTRAVSAGFRESGYYPEAFVNMLALLGWNPGTEQEIFTMDELISAFSFEHVHKAPARFDPDKARWFNGQWLQRQPVAGIAERLLPVLENAYPGKTFESGFVVRCAELLKPRIAFEHDALTTGRYLFERPSALDARAIEKKWKPGFEQFFETLARRVEGDGLPDQAGAEAAFRSVCEEHGIKPGAVLQLLRVLVSGQSGGVDLFPMLVLLGPDEVSARVREGLRTILAGTTNG